MISAEPQITARGRFQPHQSSNAPGCPALRGASARRLNAPCALISLANLCSFMREMSDSFSRRGNKVSQRLRLRLIQGHRTAKRWGLDSHPGMSDCRPPKCLGPPWYTGSTHKGKVSHVWPGAGSPRAGRAFPGWVLLTFLILC